MFLKNIATFTYILFIFNHFNSITCSNEDVSRVHIDNDDFKGSIVGKKFKDFTVEYFGFRGIPFAKPPIKELRFKDPQKLEKFQGIFDASYDGFECFSVTAQNASEDCLNLNVYTKKLTPHQLLPVVVFIHPGGLYLGSGASFFMRPGHMMTQDLVVVTFNYRLNSLGFLNLGTEEIPGNAGFKDQVFALRWVQKFIKNFGGNPQDVTLMGYSAGGLSVQLHLFSPMSTDLFHKAIIMSCALPPQTYMPQGQQKYLAVRLAKRLNCSKFLAIEEEIPYGVDGKFSDYEHVRHEDILECLNQHDGWTLGNILRSMFDFHQDNPIVLWLPVIEKDFKQERFLSENLTVAHKPVLLGYTNGELGTSARDILGNDVIRKKFSNEFDTLSPRIFMYERHEDKDKITQKIKQKYFQGSTDFSFKDHDQISDLFSDAIIRFGVQKFAQFLSKNHSLAYFYEFEFVEDREKAKDNFQNKTEGLDFFQRTFQFLLNNTSDRCEHMFDLQYLFNWPGRRHDSKIQKKIVQLYTDFIYDFVKNGKLTSPQAKPFPHSYALVKENIEYKEGWNAENYEFWSELFPNYYNINLK